MYFIYNIHYIYYIHTHTHIYIKKLPIYIPQHQEDTYRKVSKGTDLQAVL